MHVESRKKNPVLRRDEAWILLEHEGKPTPKRADIIEEAAKALKADRELVIVDKIFSREGKAASRVRAYAYSAKGDMPPSKVERSKRRMGLAKKEDAAAPAPA